MTDLERKLKQVRDNATYQALPMGARRFVIGYVENSGDKVKAGFASSDKVSSEKVAMNKYYRYIKDPVIVGLLRTFSDPGLSEPLVSSKELLQMTSTRLRNPSISTPEFIRLTEMYEELLAKRPVRKRPPTVLERVQKMEQSS